MKRIIYLILIFFVVQVNAQDNLTYQKPNKDILDLVDVQLAPAVMIDDNNEFMFLRYRDSYKTIAELSEQELRLGGLRINPKTNIGSRATYFNNLKVINLKSKGGDPVQVNGLPTNPRLANFTWSPDQKNIALTNTTEDGVSIWVVEVASAKATKLTEANINAI